LTDAQFGFTGELADTGTLTGALSGNASLDGTAVTLAGDIATNDTSRRLSGLRFTAGPTVLEGDVVQDADGLLTGDLRLASPDISTAAALAVLRATGTANAAIVLAAANGQQSA